MAEPADLITASTALAIGPAAALLAIDLLAWRVVAAMFDRERPVTAHSGDRRRHPASVTEHSEKHHPKPEEISKCPQR